VSEIKKILIFGILVIFFTFLFAQLISAIFQKASFFSITSWERWDTIHYLFIAKEGYKTEGEERLKIVFLPFYPFTIKVFAFFFRDYLFSALFVSNLAFIFVLIFLYKIVAKNFSKNIAKRTILYLTIFPTAYFFHAGYTESLFLLLVLLSFYFAKEKKWIISSFFGFLATLTRINGIVLFPVLFFEYLLQKNVDFKKIDFEILSIFLVPFGFLIYLLINYSLFGNPFQFSIFLKNHWFKKFTWPIEGLKGVTSHIKYYMAHKKEWDFSTRIHEFTISWAELIFPLFALFLIFLGFFYLPASYSFYSLLNWLGFVSTSFWLSLPRYLLSIFPIFIVFAILGEKKIFNFILIPVFLFFRFLFLFRFIRGFWAF